MSRLKQTPLHYPEIVGFAAQCPLAHLEVAREWIVDIVMSGVELNIRLEGSEYENEDEK